MYVLPPCSLTCIHLYLPTYHLLSCWSCMCLAERGQEVLFYDLLPCHIHLWQYTKSPGVPRINSRADHPTEDYLTAPMHNLCYPIPFRMCLHSIIFSREFDRRILSPTWIIFSHGSRIKLDNYSLVFATPYFTISSLLCFDHHIHSSFHPSVDL